MKVIGTAGHIDHGKSTLVHRLTGIDPDRLDEEKSRGMTIDLGFAWLTLPSGTEASIVDVPGHERFIKNMLAGAAGVDVALLVVAADEGVMPQTREHLDILDLLEVQHGVVALTKADLVDSDWLELVREDVGNGLDGTSLAGSPIVTVSATTGDGLPTLLDALDEALAAGPDPRDRGRAFVPIDRVFSIAGFGTVATGTLHDGPLVAGEEVEISPRRLKSRIRSLQTHQRGVAGAGPGARVALNLQGVSSTDLARGDVVGVKGAVVPTGRLDAWVRVLPSSALPLRHGMSVSAHLGAAERSATVSVLDGAEIAPDAAGWIQLRFTEPVAATRDQRFVIRLPAPARTIAGGVVIDISPRHRRSDRAAVQRLNDLRSPQPEVVTLSALQGQRPRSIEEIAFQSGQSVDEARRHLQALAQSGAIRLLGDRYLSETQWARTVTRVQTALRDYHMQHPLRRGMSKEELRSKIGWRFADWPEVVRALVEARLVREDGPSIALLEHGGGTSSRRADADAVLMRLKREPFTPPSAGALAEATGADRALLDAMAAEGEIVRVGQDLFFDRSTYDDMVARVLELIGREGSVTVAAVRDLFGTSRKYALSLLEHLDDERITRRNGDMRIAGSRATSHG